MQFSKRDKITGILFLRLGDFECNRTFELFLLRDFLLNRTASVSLKYTRKKLTTKHIAGNVHISLHHVNNLRRKLYSCIKNYKGDDLHPSFIRYCEINLFEPTENKNALPDFVRMYLRDVFDMKAPIEIKL